jgi:hypothetical protein
VEAIKAAIITAIPRYLSLEFITPPISLIDGLTKL